MPTASAAATAATAATALRVDHDLEVMIDGFSQRSAHDHRDLVKLRAAGLVRHASDRARERIDQSLPVAAALRPLLPGGLRRGAAVAVSGATSLLLALLAEASAAGSWCAVVGLPRLGLVAAAEAGIAVERLALVPYPGSEWASVVGALVDGVDIVVMATPTGVPAQLANRLAARARQRGGVLVPVGRWPGADLTLEVIGSTWHGLGQGQGRLRRREVEVVAYGRGAAARPRRVRMWLPGPYGAAQPPAPTLVPLRTSTSKPSTEDAAGAVIPLRLAG